MYTHTFILCILNQSKQTHLMLSSTTPKFQAPRIRRTVKENLRYSY